MIDYEKWRDALALTESNNNPRAWGDQGLACGAWQMHPAFVWQWAPDEVGELWSWNHVFEAALKAFFDELAHQAPSATQLAMWFHLHGNKGGNWDPAYAERFESYWIGCS